MKKYFYLLTICLMLFACGGNSDKESKLSKKQIQYAADINQEALNDKKNNRRQVITHAEWLDPLNLEITADFEMFGTRKPSESQKRLDDLVLAYARDGYRLTKKDICVTLIDSEKVSVISEQCVTKDDF